MEGDNYNFAVLVKMELAVEVVGLLLEELVLLVVGLLLLHLSLLSFLPFQHQ